MRLDKELQEGVLKALDWEPSVNAAQIGVTVDEGVVTLTGQVATLMQKWTAEKIARHVWGVRAIANDLTVSLDGVGTRSDSAIAHAAANAIEWNSSIPADAVQVTVRDGWVPLSGSVSWQYQKAAAERAIRNLFGVKGVANSIVVKPPVSTQNIREQIEEAFKRSADVDAKAISIEAHDGTVILRGNVHSLAERDAAERAAWAAPWRDEARRPAGRHGVTLF